MAIPEERLELTNKVYDGRLPNDEGISLFAIGTTLLRNRRRLGGWMLLGGVIAALSVISKPKLYSASASVAPQGGSDQSRSGLASLAGQFGVSLPSSVNQSLSPDFYARLLQSRVLLLPIVRDTFVVTEMGGRRVAFLDLFHIEGRQERREEKGLNILSGLVTPSVIKNIGVVEILVETEWRSVSLTIASKLVDGLNEYNEQIRHGQAASERQFVEGRLALASADLRQAEDRLTSFLRMNRQLGNSPELSLERDRIQRDVGLRQQVFTSLTQAYEDARIREVRDTPVLSVFEPPWAPTDPGPRGRLKRVLLGLVLGAIIGVLIIFTSSVISSPSLQADSEARVFLVTLRDAFKGLVPRRLRRASG
jgi:hypothetical protein